MHEAVAAALSRAIRSHVDVRSARPVGGGSIHSAYRIASERGAIFVKLGPASAAPMFAAEAAGLRALADAGVVRTPDVLALGEAEHQAFLGLEWLELISPPDDSHRRLGERLAALHRCLGREHGWPADNFIGATPQHNGRLSDWPTFFRERRLSPQLELARAKGADAGIIERGQLLAESLGAFFVTYQPAPSLLHGDLWGGNWGAMPDGTPVIFDPAVYFGDRETDMAMTRLFGGFSPSFYAAYESVWPLDPRAGARSTLYDLYHVLNHFNLFGGGYLARARVMIDRLLAQLRS